MGAEDEFLPWERAYETGIPEIDQEHRRLVVMVNQAAWAQRRKDEWILEAVLNGLLEYALVHFHHEERLMKRAGYPAFAEHVQEHVEFRRAISTLYSDYLAGRGMPGDHLTEYLRDWLRRHILGTDRLYVPHLTEFLAGRVSSGPE